MLVGVDTDANARGAGVGWMPILKNWEAVGPLILGVTMLVNDDNMKAGETKGRFWKGGGRPGSCNV